jgi:AGCS family alanine or glycine:cation symporter
LQINSVQDRQAFINAVFYIAGCLIVLVSKIDLVPQAFGLIFSNAFNSTAVDGGQLGTVIRYGVARGVFSNEAGLGSAPIAHAASKTDNPVRQAIIASLSPFIDTLVICTMTALVFVGATVNLNFVWNLSDAFNGLMAIPNLIGLLALSPVIYAMTRDYDRSLEGSKN